MSDPSVEQHIDAVDAYARTLFLRTRQDPDLYALTDAVRQLHVALRHLRVEAADPDSLLASPRDTVYAGQLRPLVDSSSATLGLLEDALDDRVDGREGAEAMLRTAGSRLRGEKASLDGFLDAVQLQKSTGAAARVVRVDDAEGLDRIKDKVDEVAKRVFSRRDSGFEDDEDRVWKEFKAELEKEGFSSTVLKKHKVCVDCVPFLLCVNADKRVGCSEGIYPQYGDHVLADRRPALSQRHARVRGRVTQNTAARVQQGGRPPGCRQRQIQPNPHRPATLTGRRATTHPSQGTAPRARESPYAASTQIPVPRSRRRRHGERRLYGAHPD